MYWCSQRHLHQASPLSPALPSHQSNGLCQAEAVCLACDELNIHATAVHISLALRVDRHLPWQWNDYWTEMQRLGNMVRFDIQHVCLRGLSFYTLKQRSCIELSNFLHFFSCPEILNFKMLCAYVEVCINLSFQIFPNIIAFPASLS